MPNSSLKGPAEINHRCSLPSQDKSQVKEDLRIFPSVFSLCISKCLLIYLKNRPVARHQQKECSLLGLLCSQHVGVPQNTMPPLWHEWIKLRMLQHGDSLAIYCTWWFGGGVSQWRRQWSIQELSVQILWQERYQKEQNKLKEEWEKAQKEVEEEERRYYEEVGNSQEGIWLVVLIPQRLSALFLSVVDVCTWPCLILLTHLRALLTSSKSHILQALKDHRSPEFSL